jgi:four helix bundle protein
MKYTRFEDLPSWKAAIDLADRVYGLTRRRFFAQPGDLRDQLRRASLSVSNNIAEGFERGSTAELLAFLYIARGSAGEVRSMFRFTLRQLDKAARLSEPQLLARKSEFRNPESSVTDLKSEISNLKSEISNLIPLAESCSRQIRAWADSLQNSDIKGQRHLNDQTRRSYDSDRCAAAFRREIQQHFREDHPELFPNDPADDP